MKKIHIIFQGNVQGVGFRYTTERIAQQTEITGYVKNLPDGTVLLEAEGLEGELNSLIKSIKSSHLGAHIHNETIAWSSPTNDFDGFFVRY